MRYYSNWLEFKGDEMVINDYLCQHDHMDSQNLEHALIRQAQCIYQHFQDDKLTLLVSGGIDSQMMAHGFLKANIPCDLIHFNITFEGRKNEAEFLFTEHFFLNNVFDADRLNFNQANFVHFNFTYQDVKLAAYEKDWLNTGCGAGHLLQLMAYEKFAQDTNGYFVSSPGIFWTTPEGGFLSNFKTTNMAGFDFERNIPFMYFSPHLIHYYEKVHRSHEVYQYYKRFEPKHLAFTELGMFLRPKLSGWECMHDADYSEFTRLDFGNHFAPTHKHVRVKDFFMEQLNMEGQKKVVNDYVQTYSLGN